MSASQLILEGENEARLLGLKNNYGTDTRSYNRSSEKREMDRQRKEATLKYERGEMKFFEFAPLCRCASWEFPHELIQHRQLRSESDWPTPEERKQRAENLDFWERAL